MGETRVYDRGTRLLLGKGFGPEVTGTVVGFRSAYGTVAYEVELDHTKGNPWPASRAEVLHENVRVSP